MENKYPVYPVLNDGFVRLVDVMGTDEDIVDAARVSYGGGTKKFRSDEKLLRHLMREAHTSPFEMAELKFHVRVPMDTWRQWVRHRCVSINEYSTRYSAAIDSCYVVDKWRKQSTTNKQGSSEEEFTEIQSWELSNREKSIQDLAKNEYQARLKDGVAREVARKDLPLSTYTEAYWKIDLHNLLHFLRLRMDPHAQYEIRQYATIIGEKIVAELFPISWHAFNDYVINSMTLSYHEIEFIKNNIPISMPVDAPEVLKNDINLCDREKKELVEKLERLGFDGLR